MKPSCFSDSPLSAPAAHPACMGGEPSCQPCAVLVPVETKTSGHGTAMSLQTATITTGISSATVALKFLRPFDARCPSSRHGNGVLIQTALWGNPPLPGCRRPPVIPARAAMTGRPLLSAITPRHHPRGPTPTGAYPVQPVAPALPPPAARRRCGKP